MNFFFCSMRVGLTAVRGDVRGDVRGEVEASRLKSIPNSSAQSDICREGITGFRKLNKIGFGTYGSIYMAIHRTTSQRFALKKFKFPESESFKDQIGLPRSAIREIRILAQLTGKCRNVVDCFGLLVSTANEANRHRGSIYMVLGFVDHDLVGILELHKRKLTLPEVKSIALQTLRAIDFCHLHGIVHRDLKCANILIDASGVVKLADFGLAREFTTASSSKIQMTNKVITLWYRPPELLLGATQYGCDVDIWSMGAILAELLLLKPLFSHDKEVQVLALIVDELGPPTSPPVLSYFHSLPYWKDCAGIITSSSAVAPFKTETALLHATSKQAWDLVSQMLHYDPQWRISAAAAIEHPFFTEAPPACEPSEIRVPKEGGVFCHGLSMKEKRERDKSGIDTGGAESKRSRH